MPHPHDYLILIMALSNMVLFFPNTGPWVWRYRWDGDVIESTPNCYPRPRQLKIVHANSYQQLHTTKQLIIFRVSKNYVIRLVLTYVCCHIVRTFRWSFKDTQAGEQTQTYDLSWPELFYQNDIPVTGLRSTLINLMLFRHYNNRSAIHKHPVHVSWALNQG